MPDYQAIARQLDQEFACRHPVLEIRSKVFSNGGRNYVEQCLTCGWTSDYLKHDKLRPEIKAMAKPVDQNLKQAWIDRRIARSGELRKEANSDWRDRYDEYLKTPAWRARRQQVLERDGGMCQGCLKRRATQVHHLTYAHVENELLFELIAVCDECHDRAHPDGGLSKW